jgi:hypothetical protein
MKSKFTGSDRVKKELRKQDRIDEKQYGCYKVFKMKFSRCNNDDNEMKPVMMDNWLPVMDVKQNIKPERVSSNFYLNVRVRKCRVYFKIQIKIEHKEMSTNMLIRYEYNITMKNNYYLSWKTPKASGEGKQVVYNGRKAKYHVQNGVFLFSIKSWSEQDEN